MNSFHLINIQGPKMDHDSFEIEPWLQESNQLPPQLFRRRIKTMHHQRDKLYRLNKTEETVMRKIKTEENGIIFKSYKHNQAKIVTLDFDRDQANHSNLKQVVLAERRRELENKKSIKGLSISALKKKPLCLYEMMPEHGSQSLSISNRKSEGKMMSASHFLLQSKIADVPKERANSLNVSKMHLKTMPVAESKDFFNEIAKLWKQKNKILSKQDKQSFNGEMKVERELFMTRNKKFKSWRRLKQNSTSQGRRTVSYAQ